MSRVEICNRGLSTYLGKYRIASFTDDTPEANQCALHYEPARQALLELHWWEFAKGRRVLAELTNDRPNEWMYKYARPTDALAIRWVNDAEAARIALESNLSPDASRETTGEAIYSNIPGATAEYTIDVTDDAALPQSFRDALSASMAALMAIPLTQDLRLAENARIAAEDMFEKARMIDARNAPPPETGLPSWMRDRGVR